LIWGDLSQKAKWCGNQQYQAKISNRFAALENLDDDVDINWARKSIREKIKASAIEIIGYYELKQY